MSGTPAWAEHPRGQTIDGPAHTGRTVQPSPGIDPGEVETDQSAQTDGPAQRGPAGTGTGTITDTTVQEILSGRPGRDTGMTVTIKRQTQRRNRPRHLGTTGTNQ